MSAKLKSIVSKNKRRFKEDGYDLDLSYIVENVIAMGYPGQKIEGIFRNNIDDVVKFLEARHGHHYKVYNLCSERSYDLSRFSSAAQFPFNDHQPPSLDMIPKFCADLQQFLSADKNNVAAVHCKAGKGRTGLMVCCYLLHAGISPNADSALSFYASRRTIDDMGVTIPSQRRYVSYYEQILKDPKAYIKRPLILQRLRVSGGPQQFVSVCINSRMSTAFELKRDAVIAVAGEQPCVCGDVKVELHSRGGFGRREKIAWFWFNTYFVGGESREEDEPTATIRFGMEGSATASCPPPSDVVRPPLPAEWRSGPALVPTLRLKQGELDGRGGCKDKSGKTLGPQFALALVFRTADHPDTTRWLRSQSETYGGSSSDTD